MTFTSTLFALFLPVVFLVYCLVNDRRRWLVLLIASYGFYASFKSPLLLLVLALVSLISYLGGLWLGKTKGYARRAAILSVGTISCLGILFCTKYLPHFHVIQQYRLISTLVSIGVSYYTFQAISYMIDVYMEVQEPETHLGYFALYMAYFPKLLQGPIERGHHLLHSCGPRIDSTMTMCGPGYFCLPGVYSVRSSSRSDWLTTSTLFTTTCTATQA